MAIQFEIVNHFKQGNGLWGSWNANKYFTRYWNAT